MQKTIRILAQFSRERLEVGWEAGQAGIGRSTTRKMCITSGWCEFNGCLAFRFWVLDRTGPDDTQSTPSVSVILFTTDVGTAKAPDVATRWVVVPYIIWPSEKRRTLSECIELESQCPDTSPLSPEESDWLSTHFANEPLSFVTLSWWLESRLHMVIQRCKRYFIDKHCIDEPAMTNEQTRSFLMGILERLRVAATLNGSNGEKIAE
ncbi:hypothetical protein B0J17DRAFT_729370 [Rhizoctonia solani]|nr:hypothetical protein B0J17DRAFT_729370 [Rhizoctonia solani]